KARSDVDNAQQEASRVTAVAQQQQHNREEANRVATDNHSLVASSSRNTTNPEPVAITDSACVLFSPLYTYGDDAQKMDVRTVR
ncbi:hypothetical protein HZD82_22445, partial [Pantoea agglomerans]|nr:hypothetical protein [Pantoea agglomerans]